MRKQRGIFAERLMSASAPEMRVSARATLAPLASGGREASAIAALRRAAKHQPSGTN